MINKLFEEEWKKQSFIKRMVLFNEKKILKHWFKMGYNYKNDNKM